MENFDLYCEKLIQSALTYSFGSKDPDRFFDAMETILDVCSEIKEKFPDKCEELSVLLDDPSEPVRRVAAFCLLEFFKCSEATEAKALKTVTDFLYGSYGAQHIVWLGWLESWEKKNNKKSEYSLRAELSPLTENYAGKWLRYTIDSQKAQKDEFLSETPTYPFDSFDFSAEEEAEDDTEEFPY